jgi:type IV pilus assembly protein PilC
METGVPIAEALDCLIEQCDHEAFRIVLEDVNASVNAGGAFSDALERHAHIFPNIMISLIRAAEVSGTLGSMLHVVSGYLAKEQRTAKKIKSALTYPAMMLVLVAAVTVFLLIFVLPSFASIYADRGATLPAPTRMLMSISNGAQTWWHIAIGGALAAAAAVVLALRTAGGRALYDTFLIRTPVLGTLFKKLYITRAFRTMGTMLAAGVPILEMVQIVRQVTPNRVFLKLWDETEANLNQGAQLSAAMFDSPLIPRSIAQMVFAGEKAGRMGPVMDKVADFTEEEFDEQVSATTQYIEPAITLLMGGVIGFVAIALLLPIFTVSNVVAS